MIIKLNLNSSKLFVSFLLFVIVFAFHSCAKNVSFQTSSVVPAAQGDVKVSKDINKNYLIKIKISNLAEVSRLEPSKKVYVVWMETDLSLIKNIGQINSDTGFMSSKLKATFETVTSFKPSKIFITAEDNADVISPGMQMVLSTNRF